MDSSYYMCNDSPNATKLAILPSVLVALWHTAFICLGIQSLVIDGALRDAPCGQLTHIWKYSLLNTVFAFFAVVTYCFFPGGGEGARARAMVMTIFHFAFLAWGGLMWHHLSPICEQVIRNYVAMHTFLWACIIHNGVFGILFFLHEAFAARMMEFDMTLVAEVTVKRDTNYPPSSAANFSQASHASPPYQAVPPVSKPDTNDGPLAKYMKNNPMPPGIDPVSATAALQEQP